MRPHTDRKEYKEGMKRIGLGSEFRNRCICAPTSILGESNEPYLINSNYSGYVFKESDWKLFRQRLPGWQERFIEKLIDEYKELLSSGKKTSEKFWELDGRIESDRKKAGVAAEMSRSTMVTNLMMLLWEGAITSSDLDGFSPELVKQVMLLYRRADEDNQE